MYGVRTGHAGIFAPRGEMDSDYGLRDSRQSDSLCEQGPAGADESGAGAEEADIGHPHKAERQRGWKVDLSGSGIEETIKAGAGRLQVRMGVHGSGISWLVWGFSTVITHGTARGWLGKGGGWQKVRFTWMSPGHEVGPSIAFGSGDGSRCCDGSSAGSIEVVGSP